MSGKLCLHCSAPIPSRGPAKDAKRIFCSRECNFAYQRARSRENGTGRLTKNCEVCGIEFSYYASVRPQAAYCSASCKSTGHSRKITGRIQASFGDRSTFTKSMRRFFYDRCAICGWDQAPCDVCHIEARKDGGEDALDNVVMLCPNHHRLFDLGRIPVDQIREARQTILRPDWRDTPEWAAWKSARAKLSNLQRWHPDDADAIAAARQALKNAYRSFACATCPAPLNGAGA